MFLKGAYCVSEVSTEFQLIITVCGDAETGPMTALNIYFFVFVHVK